MTDDDSRSKTFVRGETVINSKVISTQNIRDREYKLESKPSSSRSRDIAPINAPSSENDLEEDFKPQKKSEGKKKRTIDELKEELKQYVCCISRHVIENLIQNSPEHKSTETK